MANYRVKLSTAPKGHEIPALLADVGAWVGQQPYGSLGGFDALTAEAIPREWSPEHAVRLRREAFSFMGPPDGSLLVLVNTGAKAPPAVGLLGSEGEIRTVANSLEEFLHLWFQGETDIHELDDEDGASGLKQVFGKRKGPFGHDEPKLDDDTWDAVNAAAELLDQRFAAWLTKPE